MEGSGNWSAASEGPIEVTVKSAKRGRLATYQLAVAEEDGAPVVAREVLKFGRGQTGKPWHFVDFSRGRGTAIAKEPALGQKDAEAEREEHVLDDPSLLAIKGLGQFKQFRVAAEFRSILENWHISDFHIQEARPSAEAGEAAHLSTRGENVAQVAQYLFRHHRPTFDRILRAMHRRVPGVTGVEAKEMEDGRVVLRFQDGSFKDPFTARFVSDGTIKLFAWLVLLYDPRPHPLLAIEEPENQLYPEVLPELVEEFRDYARRGGQSWPPPTHRISSTPRNWRRSTGSRNARGSPRSTKRRTPNSSAAWWPRETHPGPSGSKASSKERACLEPPGLPPGGTLLKAAPGWPAAARLPGPGPRAGFLVHPPRGQAGPDQEHSRKLAAWTGTGAGCPSSWTRP